jgi:uncharacterized C2H2 Zn-finger protein
MTRENHRCAICAAEFGSSKDLVRHEQEQHTHHANSGGTPERASLKAQVDRARQNREFTRRNSE